ncbi:flavin-containing monooxygenase [Novosphingobium lentum]|uniref:flavin-containing monooxygenase n=1 Tax=Novosphingobium lentum TaxID=145287 RepID=UPI00082A0691|nr:NAD(P)/FAD-dependent oxidoreductase [Novosphingobium lentum]
MTAGSTPSVPDSAWLQAAIATANVPTLACILVQLTGDRRWIEGNYVPTRTRGLEDNDDGGLPETVQQEIKDAAFDALTAWFNGRPLAMPNPSDDLLLEMMSVTLGETIPSEYASIIRHELRLSPLPEDLASPPPGFSALIIGAGISGLCAAVQLAAANVPYMIVERREELGGVWFDNRYPGAACDVPSHLYSFSFAPYPWSRYFAGSREIHQYLEHVADEFDVRRHIRFGVEVIEARFDEGSGTWQADVQTKGGQRETLHANIVISGVGAFNKPRIPDVPGLALFDGPSVHTARYPDAGLDLGGRNVVLVGNGASAMQVAPAIVDEVGSLTVVQRTPQWVAPFPKFKQPIPGPLQDLLRQVPLYRLWYRLRLSWAFNDKLYDALQQDPAWQGQGRSINPINEAHRRHLTSYMTAELGDRQDLLPDVLPQYPPFGKRMLLDNGWFRALTRSHVDHVNGSVVEVRPHSVITSDGVERPADVIIWATGFDVVNLLAPMKITGIGGRDIHDDWDGDDARAYLGTVVPGYPNLFCLYGPNTQFGHGGSLITVLERQMHYVMSLLEQIFANGIATVDVRQDVHDAYNEQVDSIHSRMIWTYPGVENYCQNSKGRIVVNNPFRIIDVWGMTETADLSDYICTPLRANAAPAAKAG